MDFYNYKLAKYDDLGNMRLIDRMIRAKSAIEDRHEKEYSTLQKACDSSLAFLPNYVSPQEAVIVSGAASTTYQKELTKLRHRNDTEKVQSPRDYFLSMADKEADSIDDYVDSKISIQFDKIMKLQRLNSGKGLDAKIDGLLGRLDAKKDKLGEEITILDDQITVGQEAKDAWDNLTEVQKIDYLVSRFEAESQSEFDGKAVDEFVVTKHKLERDAETQAIADQLQKQQDEEYESLFQQ